MAAGSRCQAELSPLAIPVLQGHLYVWCAMLRLLLVVVVFAASLPPLPKVAPLPPLDHSGIEIVRQAAVDRQPGSPALGFGSVWVPSSADGIVDRVDPKTLHILARIRSGATRTRAQNQYFDSVAVSA